MVTNLPRNRYHPDATNINMELYHRRGIQSQLMTCWLFSRNRSNTRNADPSPETEAVTNNYTTSIYLEVVKPGPFTCAVTSANFALLFVRAGLPLDACLVTARGPLLRWHCFELGRRSPLDLNWKYSYGNDSSRWTFERGVDETTATMTRRRRDNDTTTTYGHDCVKHKESANPHHPPTRAACEKSPLMAPKMAPKMASKMASKTASKMAFNMPSKMAPRMACCRHPRYDPQDGPKRGGTNNSQPLTPPARLDLLSPRPSPPSFLETACLCSLLKLFLLCKYVRKSPYSQTKVCVCVCVCVHSLYDTDDTTLRQTHTSTEMSVWLNKPAKTIPSAEHSQRSCAHPLPLTSTTSEHELKLNNAKLPTPMV